MSDDYSYEYDEATKSTKCYFTDHLGVKSEVRDVQDHQRARSPDSHLAFFQRTKQAVKRQAAIAERINQVVLDRAEVNFHPDVKQVSDDTYINVLRHDPQFVPLARYQHTLTLRSGKQVRPILKGEVGLIGKTIYVLQAGLARPVVGGLDLKEGS